MRVATRALVVFALAVAGFSVMNAQQPGSTPAPTPPPQSTPPPSQMPISQPVQRPRNPFLTFPGRQSALNSVSESDRLADRVTVLQELVAPLYRKPGDKDLGRLAPSGRLITKFASMLRAEGTGIARLAPDIGCVYNERVVNASENCIKYSFPGAGNSFSFRSGTHRLRRLADISYSKQGKLEISGIFMHGMITDLGDVPIEGVLLNSPGMDYLASFKPAAESEELIPVDKAIIAGIDRDGFRYSKEVKAAVDRTYAMRLVAYRGRLVRATRGVRYNELDFDKRRDVIVVFRIVEMEEDGTATIVWRKLSDNEAPRMKMPQREGEKDDKGSNDPEAGN